MGHQGQVYSCIIFYQQQIERKNWKKIFLLLKSNYFRDHLQRKKLENNNVYVHLAETAADVQRPANPQRPVQGSTAPRGPEATIRNIESGN
jgi:hypothetical protein